jgi:Flp pilus assembly protein TadG
VRSRIHKQDGTAMIEMAMVLPLLLIILLGILDFGRALNYWNDVNQMAADGARFAAVNRNPGEASGLSLQQWLKGQAVTGELAYGDSWSVDSPLAVCIKGETATLNAGDPVTVVVRSHFNLLPMVGGEDGIVSLRVRGSATMRLEAAPTKFTTDATCV